MQTYNDCADKDKFLSKAYLIRKAIFGITKKSMFKLFYSAKWNIGVVKMPIQQFLQEPQNVEVHWMKEPKGTSFYADPFAISNKGDLEIYFEEYFGKKRKGIISKTTFTESGFNDPKTILESEIHISYPYLLSHNNKNYCIPETCALYEIALYEIVNDSLKKIKVLVGNFAGVDSTVLQWNNKWWLFCTDKKNKNADVALHIFYADDLLSAWKPHAANPVKSDRSSARPGGTPFIHNGKLYRPTQDSSKVYGGRIVLNEVIELTENKFEEKAIAFVEPAQLQGNYKKGLHTLSSAGNYTVLDAKRNVFTLSNLFAALRKRLK